ncbi:MAG: hypothetical protein V4596_10020 [Bdellovibrionota bacterium]
MGEFIENMQHTLKKNSQNIGLFAVRLFSGLFLGVTLTLVGQQILGYGQFLFWFIIVLTTAVFLKITKGWKWVGIIVLDFILVLIGLLLKMYILIAPGG